MASSRQYEFGEFRLNCVERALFRGGRLVPLTPKALETLVFLVERRGHIIEKDELMKAIWPDTFVEEVSIARNISVLRKILSDGQDGRAYIETIPKRGYRFVGEVHEVSTEAADQQVPSSSTVDLHRSLKPRRVGLYIATIVLAMGVGVIFYLVRHSKSAVPGRAMLAVLPVQNLTGDASREYVSDGLTEEMIAQLGSMNPARLGVIARTSSMAYKETRKTARQIGLELGVDYILETSLREDKGHSRFTAQLIRTRDQTHLWAKDYDRAPGDLLVFQSDVAREVSHEVSLNLTPQEQPMLETARRPKPEAYDAYLKGRFFWNKRTPEAMTVAASYFHQAVQADPDFALGYVGLSDCYQVMVNLEQLKAKEGLPMAKAAAVKALELDKSLAEAHTSLASLRGDFDWDWQGAEAEYRQALALNPNDANAHHWYGDFLAGLGRFDESADEIRKAKKLDPLSPVIEVTLAQLYCTTGHCEQGIEQLKKTLEFYPDFDEAHGALAEIYAHQGMYQKALAEMGKERQLPEGHLTFLTGYAAAKAGHKEEALNVSHQLEKQRDFHHRDYYLAVLYSALGDKDQAFGALERARLSHDPFMPYFRGNFPLEELRSDPRYAELFRRMNMPR